MGSAPGIPVEGDLHRLVDGLLDAQRQGEVLLHLRGNTAEVAHVAAWREQNDLLKATFAGVEHETIPASLRLTPLRLRCIGDADEAEPMPAAAPASPARAASVRPAVAISLCLAASLAAWMAVNRPDLKSTSAHFASGQDTDDLMTASMPPDQARSGASELPLATIPDLGGAGFTFTSSTLRPGSPNVMVFSYRSGGSGRLTLSVSRSPRERLEQPSSVIWYRDGRRYVLGGSGLDPDRFAAAASVLQASGSARPND